MAPVTAGQLADLQRPDRVRISPDGKYVLYTMRRRWNRDKDMKASLWIAEMGKEHSARQLTRGEYYDSNPEFSPDGRHIAFVSDRHSRGKAAVIYLLPVGNGGEALPLTPVENEQSIDAYRWSTDGKMIAFISKDEKTKEKKEREQNGDDAEVYGDWEYARLRTVSIETREVTTLVSRDSHVTDLAWSPDSKEVAYVTRKSPQADDWMTSADVHMVDCGRKESRELCCLKSAIVEFHWFQSTLLFIAKQDGKSLLTSDTFWSIDVQSGKAETVVHDPESCAMSLRLCSGEVILHRGHGLYEYLDRYPSGERIFQPKFDLATGWDVHPHGIAYIKIAHSGGNVFAQIDGKETQLSNHESVDIPLQAKIAIETKAEDGTPVDGWLYTPKSANGAMVVVVHGGPYWRYIDGTEDFMGFFEWLLALEYTVLRPNYRGGSGHGPKYAEAVIGDGSVSYHDVIACLQFCIDQDLIKKERIAIMGWSQGGYMTYVAVTRDQTFHFDAAIAGAGVTDVDAMATTNDCPTFVGAMAGGLPWLIYSEDTRARRGSPLFHMNDIHTPLLIVHGEKDGRVPLNQAWGFHRGMLARKKECEMVVYPREGHGFEPFERTHYVHLLEKIREFFGKHLQGS